MKEKISRRSFLTAAGISVAALAMAGCSDPNGGSAASSSTTAASAPAASTAASANATAAVDWPKQPVNIMCPAAAGGGTDMILRIMSEYFTKLTGQSWVINNVTGISGYEQTYQANPDGYNFILGTTTIFTSKEDGTLSYDWSDFSMVGLYEGDYSTCIAVQADSPYQTINDLLDAAKADPQSVTGGITLSGQPYMFAESLKNTTGIDLYYVDVGNTSERNAALLGGQVDYIITNNMSVTGYVDSGDFRILAIDGKERNPFTPDVPTFIEQGIDFCFYPQPMIWLAPANTDPAICEAFNSILNQIYADPNCVEDFKTKLKMSAHEMPSVEDSITLAQEYTDVFSQYIVK